MPDVTDQQIHKIAILRALKLGDFLVAVPALRALRMAFPQAEIDYIGLPMTRELVERYDHYLDNFIEFPGFPGLPEREFEPGQVVDFIQNMQTRHYDLVLQMQGSGRYVNGLVSLFGAKTTAGYALDGGYWPNHDYFLPYPSDQPEVLKYLRLMEHVGIQPQGTGLEFPIQDADKQRLRAVYDYEARPYVCVHPGSTSAARWPVDRFAAVARTLIADGYDIAITGTASEGSLTAQLHAMLPEHSVDLAGRTDLGSLAVLLKQSAAVVSNDTGVAHLANAVDAPSVTVFTTADPAIWAALNQAKHPFVTLADAATDTVIQMVRALIQGESYDTHSN